MQLTNTMRFRATPEFHDAIKAASSERLISASAYVRQAIAEQLRRDGGAQPGREASRNDH